MCLLLQYLLQSCSRGGGGNFPLLVESTYYSITSCSKGPVLITAVPITKLFVLRCVVKLVQIGHGDGVVQRILCSLCVAHTHTRRWRVLLGNVGVIPARWLPVPAIVTTDALVTATATIAVAVAANALVSGTATLPVRVPAALHAPEYDDATRVPGQPGTVHDAAAGAGMACTEKLPPCLLVRARQKSEHSPRSRTHLPHARLHDTTKQMIPVPVQSMQRMPQQVPCSTLQCSYHLHTNGLPKHAARPCAKAKGMHRRSTPGYPCARSGILKTCTEPAH